MVGDVENGALAPAPKREDRCRDNDSTAYEGSYEEDGDVEREQRNERANYEQDDEDSG